MARGDTTRGSTSRRPATGRLRGRLTARTHRLSLPWLPRLIAGLGALWLPLALPPVAHAQVPVFPCPSPACAIVEGPAVRPAGVEVELVAAATLAGVPLPARSRLAVLGGPPGRSFVLPLDITGRVDAPPGATVLVNGGPLPQGLVLVIPGSGASVTVGPGANPGRVRFRGPDTPLAVPAPPPALLPRTGSQGSYSVIALGVVLACAGGLVVRLPIRPRVPRTRAGRC